MPNDFDDRVCILTPCYNGMPYLPQALDSALAQTHRPAQIVVVDDGSTDDSVACVRQYQAQHPHAGIELVQRPNGGEVAARNTGLDHIRRTQRAAWVAMLDADDWWEPDKLAKQLLAAQQAGPDCVLVHTGTVPEFPPGMEHLRTHRNTDPRAHPAARRVGRCLPALLEPGSIGHPSILVRRDALESVGGYDPEFPHACDVNLYFHLARLGSFAYVPENLLHYRIHPRQTSFNFKLDQTRYQIKVIDDFFRQHPEDERAVGRDKIDAERARFIEMKLESLYWRRRLADFRALLAFAHDKRIDSSAIRRWKRRAILPDWLIHLRDRLSASPRQAPDAGGPT